MTFLEYIDEVSFPTRQIASLALASPDDGHDIDHMPLVFYMERGDQRLVVVPYVVPGNLTCEVTMWDGDVEVQRELIACRVPT